MTYTPISGSVPQYQAADGTLASGYYLKFYSAGTTTPLSMATDSTGGTTLAKAQINTAGYPINGSGDVFIPHISQSYKIVLYKNATDADNDTTGNADWVIDNISQSAAATPTQVINIEYQLGSEASGQVFTLSEFTYALGVNNLLVYRNGNLLRQGVSNDYEETSASSVTINSSITIASTDQFAFVKGTSTTSTISDAASVTYTPAGSGAVATNVQDKLRESVSVTDFGADPTGAADSTTAFNNALGTGKNVYVPDGKYVITSAIQMITDGQSLFGSGTYTCELEWQGSSGNFIELLSGRRDGLGASAAVTNMRFENFKLSTKTGSTMTSGSIIWVEAGVFHSQIENIRMFDLRGGRPAAGIKFDSNSGSSYPLNVCVRDVVITGGLNDDTLAIPRGIWVEAGIELYFERVHVYTVENGWILGTNVSGDIRNVVNCTFVKCQSEIGDRGYATDTGKAVLIYQARDLSFISCKFMAGADFSTTTNQRALYFSGGNNFQNRGIRFYGCDIWGMEKCLNGIYFDNLGEYRRVSFESCTFYGMVNTIIDTQGENKPQIDITNPNFLEAEPVIGANFCLECDGFSGTTINNASGSTFALLNSSDTSQYGRAEPLVFGCDQSLAGLMGTAYKNSINSTEVRIYNRSGGNVTLNDGFFNIKKFKDHEIKAKGFKTYDPPSLAAAASNSTTVTVFGAALGDFVAVGFDSGAGASDGLQDVNLFGYVSAADTVTVYFVNRTSGTRDLASGNLVVYVLNPLFYHTGTATYDAPSLAANAGATTTVTVTGAELGDVPVFSFGLDMSGVVGFATVSAANTVSIRLQNESGGVVDLASTTVRVGLYKNHDTF